MKTHSRSQDGDQDGGTDMLAWLVSQMHDNQAGEMTGRDKWVSCPGLWEREGRGRVLSKFIDTVHVLSGGPIQKTLSRPPAKAVIGPVDKHI